MLWRLALRDNARAEELTQGENALLTQVGPGKPMGELMRRYWITAAFSHQLAKPDGPPIRVRLMGENLVAKARAMMKLEEK